ncbi:thiamine biosynthesis lipoprotein ApbE [Bradyrhizobium sp. USDA 4353]
MDGQFDRLFDPKIGRCAELHISFSTVARDATTADALSTAVSLMAEAEICALMPRTDLQRVHLIDAPGVAVDLVRDLGHEDRGRTVSYEPAGSAQN